MAWAPSDLPMSSSQKSGGKLKVKLYAGRNARRRGRSSPLAMQGGTIEMSMMGPGLLTGMDKDFGIFDTPFLFDNFKEADAILDGPVGKKLLDKLPAKGWLVLSYWDHGFRILTNSRRPVAKMEDIQGLKIRVQQIPVFIDTFTTLGANAVPMPFTELYTALETKTVDGQENPFVSDRGDQVLRGAEVRLQHPPRLLSSARAREQEVLGSAL